MPRFAASLNMLFREHALLDRFAAAAAAGFRGVEVQFPYEHPPEAVAARARDAGLEVVLINLPIGDVEAGEIGIACHPDRRDEFRAGIEQGLRYSAALQCRRVNIIAGRPPAGASEDACREALIANLREAAEHFARAGIRVMVEPVNGRERPGFFLQTIDAALAVIDAAGHPNLWLQFDLYHRQVMRGDLIEGLRAHLARTAHIQFADNPGRHEPGTGEINFPQIFAALDALGWDGWLGAEYAPSRRTEETLGWIGG
jgi:hydroxypyruvate isomerase